jgi:hypothetical protein
MKINVVGRCVTAICLCLVVALPSNPQGTDSSDLEIYNGCGTVGDARSPGGRALNRLKNRYAAPKKSTQRSPSRHACSWQ